MKKIIIFTNAFTINGNPAFTNNYAKYGNEIKAIAISEIGQLTPINNPQDFNFSETLILITLENNTYCFAWNNLLDGCQDLYIVLHTTGQAALLGAIDNYINQIKSGHQINIFYRSESHTPGSIYYEWLPKTFKISNSDGVNNLIGELVEELSMPVLEAKLGLLHEIYAQDKSIEDVWKGANYALLESNYKIALTDFYKNNMLEHNLKLRTLRDAFFGKGLN